MPDKRRRFRSLSDSRGGFFENLNVLRGEELVTPGASAPNCHAVRGGIVERDLAWFFRRRGYQACSHKNRFAAPNYAYGCPVSSQPEARLLINCRTAMKMCSASSSVYLLSTFIVA